MIALIDYGAGNLFSVKRALDAVKANYFLASKPTELTKAEKFVLLKVIRNEVKQKPIFGICLGMQLMMEEGYEFGKHKGLGLIKGKVDTIKTNAKLPQIGWNQIRKQKKSQLLNQIKDKEFFYFVHSFVTRPTDKAVIAATTNYGGDEFCSVIEFKNIFGAQFHPEKSSSEGIRLYQNFVKLKA